MAIPEVNERLLKQLEEMGFPFARATRALYYSGNSGLEDAITWIVENENEPGIDQLPLVPSDIDLDSATPFHMTELVKMKAEDLRNGRQQPRKEVQKNSGREREKAERRSKLGLPPATSSSVQPAFQMVQEKSIEVSKAISSSKKAELLSDCLRSLRRNHKEEDFKVKRALQTLYTYIRNIVNNPDVEKFRKIRMTNPVFQERVGCLREAVRFLELCGFERSNKGQFLHLSSYKFQLQILNSAITALHSAITNPYFGILSVDLP